MAEEDERTRLIGAIARVLCAGPVPEEPRAAALTLIGWLARRMPGEAAGTVGVQEMIARVCPLTASSPGVDRRSELGSGRSRAAGRRGR